MFQMFPRQSRSLSSKTFRGTCVYLVVDRRHRDNVENHSDSHGWSSTRATPSEVVPQEKIHQSGKSSPSVLLAWLKIPGPNGI